LEEVNLNEGPGLSAFMEYEEECGKMGRHETEEEEEEEEEEEGEE